MSCKAPVRHHYVPRFVLNNFAANPRQKKKKIFVFDKWENKVFQTNVNNVGCENHFYDFKVHGAEATAELGLAKVDGDAAPQIRKIVETENLNTLSDDEKVLLAVFMAIQLTRVPQHRDMVTGLYKDLFDIVGDMYGVREIDGEKEPSLEEIKSDTCVNLADFKVYAKALLSKGWVLMRAPDGERFHTSDNPLVMQNKTKQDPFWGNLGLECVGIEIYMPLSKKIVLAMFCPSHFEAGERTLARAKAMSAPNPGAFQTVEVKEKIRGIEEFLKAPAQGTPITVSKDVVINANSLQTKWSRRYVFSSGNDFSLPKEILEKYPDYKTGIKAKLQK